MNTFCYFRFRLLHVGVSFRRYLALCVGETRVRFDLQAPLRPLVKKSHGKKSGKISVSPTTLRFLSQVWSLAVGQSFAQLILRTISNLVSCVFSCCHSTSAPSMWWSWTLHGQSLYGTWLFQASLCCLTTRVKGNYAVHTMLFLSPLSSPSDLTIKFNGEKKIITRPRMMVQW